MLNEMNSPSLDVAEDCSRVRERNRRGFLGRDHPNLFAAPVAPGKISGLGATNRQPFSIFKGHYCLVFCLRLISAFKGLGWSGRLLLESCAPEKPAGETR